MVESLVDIAYRRLKKREEYESRHGSGSYRRKVLEPFLGKHVAVQGWVAAIYIEGEFYRVTLRDVIIQGRELDHINFNLSEDSKYLQTVIDALRCHAVIKMKAGIKSYRSGSRSTFGLAEVTYIELFRKGEEAPITCGVTPYFTNMGYNPIFKWRNFRREGFSYYNLCDVVLIEESYLGYLERLLSCSQGIRMRRYTEGELAIVGEYKSKNPYTRSRILQESLENKGNLEYLCYLQYERSVEELRMGLDVADIHSFSSYQSKQYVEMLRTLGDWVPIPMKNEVFNDKTGVPFVLKLRHRMSYSIIYPSIREDASYLNSVENLKKLFEDFRIPSGARVSVYNPVLNRFAEINSEVVLNG